MGGFLGCSPRAQPPQEAGPPPPGKLAVLATSSPSSQGLLLLSQDLCPACAGFSDFRKVLRKLRGKGGPLPALSRSSQQSYGIVRSYIHKMHLLKEFLSSLAPDIPQPMRGARDVDFSTHIQTAFCPRGSRPREKRRGSAQERIQPAEVGFGPKSGLPLE